MTEQESKRIVDAYFDDDKHAAFIKNILQATLLKGKKMARAMGELIFEDVEKFIENEKEQLERADIHTGSKYQ